MQHLKSDFTNNLFFPPYQLLSTTSVMILVTTMKLWIVPGEPQMKLDFTFVMKISPGMAGIDFFTME